eukprot:1158710-Pelagomonas_calceolata.AAC.1
MKEFICTTWGSGSCGMTCCARAQTDQGILPEQTRFRSLSECTDNESPSCVAVPPSPCPYPFPSRKRLVLLLLLAQDVLGKTVKLGKRLRGKDAVPKAILRCSFSSNCCLFRFVLGKTVKLGKQLQDGDTVSNGPAALQALLDGAEVQ